MTTWSLKVLKGCYLRGDVFFLPRALLAQLLVPPLVPPPPVSRPPVPPPVLGSALVPVCHMSVASPPSCPASAAGSLGCLAARLDNSWVAQLRPDPSSKPPNKRAREVHSGHYVLVKPTPLKRPYLVTYSRDVLRMLELSEAEAEAESSPFVRLFSGATDAVAGFQATWATPYALSIYGEEVQPNGAGASGNGYGDGRAISIGEVLTAAGQRWELQLKGGGATPFCRHADGRAVLRSSVREYVASEAMHHMGVPTTRALSLIASRSDTVLRPWYAPSTYAANANTTAPHSNTCVDADAQCPAWAMLGECGRNTAFMRDKCAESRPPRPNPRPHPQA